MSSNGSEMIHFHKVALNSESGVKKAAASKARHIVVAAKAKQTDPETNEVDFLPVRISYRKLELLGHGVFGVVHAARVSEVHSSHERGHKVDVYQKFGFS